MPLAATARAHDIKDLDDGNPEDMTVMAAEVVVPDPDSTDRNST